MGGDVVVDTPTRQDDLGVVPHFLRLVGQVIRVHANAMPSYQARTKRQEVPFAASSLQNLQRVYPQASKDQA